MKRRMLSIFTALAMCLSLFTPALAAEPYLDKNGVTQTLNAANEVKDSDTKWGFDSTEEIWYIARDNITIDRRVTVQRDVHLILADGCNLTVSGGIHVPAGTSLTIYAQSIGDGMGALTANATSNDDAAIGGSLTVEDGYNITDNGSYGTITINGGRVTATSTGSGAGIGGGHNAPGWERPSGGTITINGGIVTADSGYGGAGIGGGENGIGGSVTITGGTVKATSTGNGAAIGGGSNAGGGTITITGGTVEASGKSGAGIGGGAGGDGGTISISGGEITATSATSGAGIGGGGGGDGGIITITGGAVSASGNLGAGVGGGYNGSGGTISISGGAVTASSTRGAGVGGGYQGGSGTFSTGAGNAVIYADSIADADGTSGWSGIIFQGDAGQVYGSPALAEDVTVPEGKTLEVGEGATLTIPSGKRLTVTEPLTNNGTIQIDGTLSVTSLTDYGSLTGEGTLLINGKEDRLDQEKAPAAPDVLSVTENSVTLAAITGGAGAEYKCGDGDWQPSPEFTGLESATQYTFYARYKESKFYNASPASAGTIAYTAAAAPSANVAVIDYGAETIRFDDTCEMNTAADFNGTDISSGDPVTGYIGQTLYIRVRAAGGVPASAATAVPIPTRPEAPAGLSATREDYSVSDNGTISGVSGEMEYKLSTAEGWTDCAEDTITGLSVGTYQVRLKATDSAFAGEAAEVSILPSGTEFVGGLKTYNINGITVQNKFAISETIVAKATPTATGEAPAMLAASLDAPGPGQMALFVGDIQVSGAVGPDGNGVYTMTADAEAVAVAAGQMGQITLTAKYIGTGNMADAQATATVTITAAGAAAQVEKDGEVTDYLTAASLPGAFTAANDGATVTLLENVSVSGTLALTENAQITLDLSGKTLGYAIRVEGGALTIINGGTVTGQITAAGGKLTLGPGTYRGGIQSTGGAALKDFLENYGSEAGPHYAYFQGGKLVTEDATQLAGPVTVKECTEHSYEYMITIGDVEKPQGQYFRFQSKAPTHTATCRACGYHEEQKHTVVPLSEIGYDLEDYYDELKHDFYCPDCDTHVNGDHIYDTGDPTGTCIVCGLSPVARVDRNGTRVTAVGLYQLETLFEKANGAVVTLERDAEAEHAVTATTPDNSDCTLDFAGHTLGYVGVTVPSGSSLTVQDSGSGGGLTSGGLYVIGTAQITGGSICNPKGNAISTVGAVSLDISGDTTVEGTTGLNFQAAVPGASLTISGTPQFTGTGDNGVGLRITGGVGKVQLKGGTYSGEKAAIQIEGTGLTLKDLLYQDDDVRYVFLDEDGKPIMLKEGQTKLEGTVTVGLCTHLFSYTHVDNEFRHNRKCQVCGHLADDEPCTYVWPEGGGTGTCATCGDELTVTVTGADGLIYTGQEHKPAVEVTHGGAEVVSGDYTVTYKDNVNAGIATVTVSSEKFSGSYTQSYGIAKAAPKIAWEEIEQEVTYTGQPAVVTGPGVALVNSEQYKGEIQYAYDGYTGPDLPTNAGSYTITASIAEQDNYTAAETETALALTINKADAKIVTEPKDQGLTYNKTAQALVSEGTSTFGTVVYALSEDGPYSAEIPTATNAGAYSVWYMVEGTDNYNGIKPTEVKVNIAKADYTDTTAANAAAKYGTTGTYDLTALLQDIDGAELGEIKAAGDIFEGTPTVSGRALSFKLAEVEAGKTGTITIPVSSTNYKNFDLTITVTVTDKDVPELSVSEISVTYSVGPVPASAIKGTATVDGKAVSGTWSFAGGQAVTNVADSGVKAVKFTPSDDTYAAAECTVKVTISKATPSGAPKYTAISASGKRLSEVELTAPDGWPAGSFTWAEGGDTEVTAGTSYQWIFTPDDTDNYNSLSGSVVLWRRSTGGGGGYVPSTGGNSAVSTGTSQGSTVTTATPTASVQGNTAVAKVDASMGQEIVKQAVANGSESVVIAPKITGSVTRTEVSIPASTVGQIGSQTGASLTISTPVAGVTIPNGGLGSLSSEGGTITVSAEMQGSTVELSVTADGKTVERVPGGVTLTVPMADTTPGTVAVLVRPDGAWETVRKSVARDGGVTIPLDGSAKLVIVDNSKQFSDVPATRWAAEAIAFAGAHELFIGTAPGQFSPNIPMSRGMLAVVLHNLENNPNQALTGIFADVGGGAWYAEGIAWAAQNGIVSGYGNGQFGPNDPVTREQLAVMLWRYAGSPAATNKELHFTDADEINGYALEALRWAVENGILNGYGNGQIRPGGQATRAEAAQMLKNFMEKQ